MAQFLVVTVSLFLIYRQLRVQGRNHLISSLDSLDKRWNSDLLINARKVLCENWETKDSMDPAGQLVAGFFEELGVYVRQDILSKDVVWEIYSHYIEHYWSMLAPPINKVRSTMRDPTSYTNFESLYNTMISHSKKKGAPEFMRTEEQIRHFSRAELAAVRLLGGGEAEIRALSSRQDTALKQLPADTGGGPSDESRASRD